MSYSVYDKNGVKKTLIEKSEVDSRIECARIFAPNIDSNGQFKVPDVGDQRHVVIVKIAYNGAYAWVDSTIFLENGEPFQIVNHTPWEITSGDISKNNDGSITITKGNMYAKCLVIYS